jgi:branched-chain amino acid transport system substrate-binding protein
MARFAQLEGYEQVAIVYVRNAYGLGLANAFETSATDAGVNVVGRNAYDATTSTTRPNFSRLINGLGGLNADAIFLAGMAPEAGYLIADIRKAGIDIPIFGGDALDTEDLIGAAGDAADGVVIASVFHPDNPRQEVQNFNEAFRAEYGTLPDSWAARGYEALKLLVHAMNEAGSVVPDRVADALRSLDGWSGLTGTFVFDDHGDVVGKEVMTVVVDEGRFRFRGEQQAVSVSYDRDRERRSDDLQWVNTRVR